MKTTILLFLLSFSSVYAQVECIKQDHNFSGECESYNALTGARSKYNYKKGTLHGKFEESFTNGQQRSSGSYKGGLLNGKFNAFYSTGDKLTLAKFKSGTGSFTMFHKNGVTKNIGQFEKGQASGKWSFFNTDGELSRELEMNDGQLDMYDFLIDAEPIEREISFDDFFDSFDDSGFSFSFGDDSDSTFVRMRQQMNESMQQMQLQMEQMMQGFSDTSSTNSFKFDTTFTFNNFDGFDGFFEFESFGDSAFSKSFHFDTIMGEIPERSNPFFSSRDNNLVDFPDTEPSFVGGTEAMEAFIQHEMEALNIEKEGTVFIEAIIELDGSISNSRVALGVSRALDDEAMLIVAKMPLWKTAMANHKPVRSRCIIPVRFK